MSRVRNCPAPSPDDAVAAYLVFLMRHRGISAVSICRHNRKALYDLCIYLKRRHLTLEQLQVKDLDDFIVTAASLYPSKSYLSERTSALRGFFRYLFGEGLLPRDLSRYVEGPRIYRDAIIPPHFTWNEVMQLCKSVNGKDSIAIRDRLMLVLLCIYGLRSGEVVSLTLDDIDWTHKLLRVSKRKMDNPLVLPLLPIVETALCDYITKGRPPESPFREIMLSKNGQPLKRGLVLACRLHHLVAQAGLKGGRGCHALRRAVGTHLVEQGCSLEQVALVLGHKGLRSAKVYLRLSVESLREVAENFGEVL
jgi:site-specific recombinase XerD